MVVERIRQLDQVGETSDVKVQPAAAAEKGAAVSQYVLDKRDSDLKILSRERGRLERSNQIEKESGGELERHHASRWQIAKNATEGKVNTALSVHSPFLIHRNHYTSYTIIG
jgi:septum formation inhibitor MinC